MTMKLMLQVGAAALALMSAACGGQTPPPEPAPETASAQPEAQSCPDDGPRLPITGLCKGRVSNYLDPAAQLISTTPDGCAWEFTETAFPGGDEALVHRVLTCKGVTTTFEFGGGAHSAVLAYATSALYGGPIAGDPVEPVRIFTADPADPQKAIRDLFEGIPEAERAKCSIQPAGVDFWPSDALVIAWSAEDRAKESDQEPITMCGEFGRDEDSASYWRVFGGYAWFFMMGQDDSDFDPASFMLFRKDADGAWSPAP